LEILSYIPGLGYLAEKGASKIQEFRNLLTGIDGATVTADVTKTVETELTPPTNTGAPSPYDVPGFGIPGPPGFGSGGGAAGKSKLHGVVDISGGAIPILNEDGTYTTTGAVNEASPGESVITRTAIEIAAILQRIDAGVSLIARSLPIPARAELSPIAAMESVFTTTSSVVNNYALAPGPAGESVFERTAIEIAAILQRIDAGVSLIARSLPIPARAELSSIAAPETATRVSPITPRVNMGGDDGARDYYNPRNVAPITQADRTAYSFNERREIVIEVAAEKGTAARIVRAPRDVDIQLVASGGNA
jgi:hypothetical protein